MSQLPVGAVGLVARGRVCANFSLFFAILRRTGPGSLCNIAKFCDNLCRRHRKCLVGVPRIIKQLWKGSRGVCVYNCATKPHGESCRCRHSTGAVNSTPSPSPSSRVQAQNGFIKVIMFTKYTLRELYGFYFALFRAFGIFPFHFDPKTLQVHRLRTRQQRFVTGFNVVFMVVYFFSEGYLLVYNHFTRYQYDTIKNGYLLQGLWFVGSIVVGTIIGTFLWYADDLAQLLTTSFRVEQFVFDAMTEEELPLKRQIRTNAFRKQVIMYVVAVLSSPMGLIPINIFFPRFPSFLNSLFMTDASSSRTALDPYLSNHPALLCTVNILIRLVFHVREVYFPLLAWASFGNCDILMNAVFSIMSRTTEHAQNVIMDLSSNSVDDPRSTRRRYEALNLYSGLRAQLVRTDKILGSLIFYQEMTNLIMNALVVYAALVFENPILVAFFGFNIFTVTARMYIFYLPISGILAKSTKFIKCLKRAIPKSNKLLYAKKRTLRPLFMRPLGVHRITTSSISDYILAVLSYFVVAIKK